MGNPRDPLRERGKHYFHSSFNDVVLSGLVGIRPSADSFEVAPLVSSRGVKWFAATGIRVRWFDVAVVWDADGERYGHGAGLHLWLDGRHAASAPPTEAGGAPRLKVWPDGRVETRGGAKIA